MLVARQGRRRKANLRNLLDRRQRRVALERVRERRGARGTDLVVMQTAARRGGSGMLVEDRAAGTEQGARNLL
jgi:hypothetical protein